MSSPSCSVITALDLNSSQMNAVYASPPPPADFLLLYNPLSQFSLTHTKALITKVFCRFIKLSIISTLCMCAKCCQHPVVKHFVLMFVSWVERLEILLLKNSKDITKNRKKVIYNSMVKSVLTYGAETWSLYEDDRRRINGTEMDVLRRSARISKLDRKTNEYIREKNVRSRYGTG